MPACHKFPCRKREFQIFIFLSVCSRTPRYFTFLLNLISMVNLFMDPNFHLIQYLKCQAVLKKSYYTHTSHTRYLTENIQNV